MNVRLYRPSSILGTVVMMDPNSPVTRYLLRKAESVLFDARPSPQIAEAKRALEKALNLEGGSLSKVTDGGISQVGNRTTGVTFIEVFSAKMESTVRDFQQRQSLPTTGILDGATWSALLNRPVTAVELGAPTSTLDTLINSFRPPVSVVPGYQPGTTTSSPYPSVAAAIPPGAYCVQQLPAGMMGNGSMVKPNGDGSCPSGYRIVIPRPDASFDPGAEQRIAAKRAEAKALIEAASDATLLSWQRAYTAGQPIMVGTKDATGELLVHMDLVAMEIAKRNLSVKPDEGVTALPQQQQPAVGSSKSASTAAPAPEEKKMNWVLPAVGGALVLGFFLMRKRA